MKKVNMETEYNVLKEVAKELGIKFVGVKKEVLVENINAKIEEITPEATTVKTKGKWFEQENAFPYEVGEIVFINSTYKYEGIHNRLVEIAGPSTKKNAIKGYLINPANGEKQKTCISLDFTDIELMNNSVQSEAV